MSQINRRSFFKYGAGIFGVLAGLKSGILSSSALAEVAKLDAGLEGKLKYVSGVKSLITSKAGEAVVKFKGQASGHYKKLQKFLDKKDNADLKAKLGKTSAPNCLVCKHYTPQKDGYGYCARIKEAKKGSKEKKMVNKNGWCQMWVLLEKKAELMKRIA
jgi:hypothetical protein